jgi:hypothetical protein
MSSTRSSLKRWFEKTVDGASDFCDLTTPKDLWKKQFGRTVKYRRSITQKAFDKTLNTVPKQDQDFIDLLKWALLIVIILVFIYSFWKILQPSAFSLYRFIEFFVLFVCGFLIFLWFQKFWYGVNLF